MEMSIHTQVQLETKRIQTTIIMETVSILIITLQVIKQNTQNITITIATTIQSHRLIPRHLITMDINLKINSFKKSPTCKNKKRFTILL
jgi:hypothetical protein